MSNVLTLAPAVSGVYRDPRKPNYDQWVFNTRETEDGLWRIHRNYWNREQAEAARTTYLQENS